MTQSFVEQSHPETDHSKKLPATTTAETRPYNKAVRARVESLVESGMSLSDIARGATVNKSIVVQYLNPAGNTYSGRIEVYEQKLMNWIENRDIEFLAGIKTVETSVTKQLDSLARAVRQQRIIGKAIGVAGIGKTRGTSHLAAKDASIMAYYATKLTGTRDCILRWLFEKFGIRGGKKTYGQSTVDKYNELVKRARANDGDKSTLLFVFDQAHMLSIPAMHFLCEFWNQTRRSQLWIGPDALLDKVERDAQIASRVRFGDELTVSADEARDVIKHQISELIPDANGETNQLVNKCQELIGSGCFRDVEMILGTMIYLSEKPSGKDKSWCQLFDSARAFNLKK